MEGTMSPEDSIRYRHDILGRIRNRVVETSNGCLEYRSRKGKNKVAHPYGLISITINGKRKSVPAARALWMATNEEWYLPRDIQILHKCDNPPCCNIDHIYAGDATRNMKDCVDRDRYAKCHAYRCRNRVHDANKVLAIFNAEGKVKQIAYKFRVSNGYVSRIKSGKLKAAITQPLW